MSVRPESYLPVPQVHASFDRLQVVNGPALLADHIISTPNDDERPTFQARTVVVRHR